MRSCILSAVFVGLSLFLASDSSAQTVTFTNDTTINFFDTNYEGAAIVITNCTVTMNGPHTFSNVLVAAGGTLTHTGPGTTTNSFIHRSFTNEVQVLVDTNAVTLSNTGSFIQGNVSDATDTVLYAFGIDYLFTFPGGDLIQLQRLPGSAIPDGATVLVDYSVFAATPAGLFLNVTGNVEIASGGAINVDGKGYSGNFGPGKGGTSPFSPTSGGGAGYGGYGGISLENGAGGAAYGSFTQPVDLGSGGGYGVGGISFPGGAGGGLVRITAGGSVIVDGVLSAKGSTATNSRAGGGSGGSIWLTAPTISGAGAINANGGAGEPVHGGGGGGGRIAVEADSVDFSGSTTACGAAGGQIGGAGTIYTKLSAQNGTLLIDNGNQSGTNTLLQVANGADVTVRGSAIASASGTQSIGKLLVGSNGVVTALSPATTLTINSAGDATIEFSGTIIADGLGPSASAGAGGFATVGGVIYGGGGGHGGYGGMGGNGARGGGTHDSTSAPTVSGGAGGGSPSSTPPFGGRGGGSIRMTIGGKLTLNGSISSDGKIGSGAYAGGGAGGSVWLTLGTWSGSGIVSANGGPGVSPAGGGGGGGRISVSFNSNSFTGLVLAYGGTGTNNGGAGSIYLKTNSQSIARVILDNGGGAGTNSSIDSISTVDVSVGGNANLFIPASSWVVRNLEIRSNSSVSAMVQTFPALYTITTTGDVTIDAGGVLHADGAGFGPGQGSGPGYQLSTLVPKGGGGYGGYGGANPGGGNWGTVYGSIINAISPGSGGGSGSGTTSPPLGGAGGGVLTLHTHALIVNGRLSASGLAGDLNSGGGAGGTLNITCNPLSGSGVLSANGGAGNGNAGGGGGGRIYMIWSSNNFTGSLRAFGGNGLVAGGAGTICTRSNPPTVFDLLISNGGLIGTNTPLSFGLGLPPSPFNLTITDRATVVLMQSQLQLSNLTIAGNSVFTTFTNQPNSMFIIAKNVNIAPGSTLSVDGKGFSRGNGQGAGSSVSGKGSGGGYGGIGGASGSGAIGGTNYGSATQPVDRGSGGGAGANLFLGGSDGGGTVHLVVGDTLKVDGVLSANGNPGLQDDSGGGAGGSIWVLADTLSGNGIISASGGDGELFGGGGGGGGRMAVYSRSNAFAGVMSVSGGMGANPGDLGSLLLSTNLATVSGAITDTNGLPVAGVLLQASIGNASATTAADGTYQLSLVPYASFTVTPSFNNFVFVPGSRGYNFGFTSISNQDYLMFDSIVPTLTSSVQDVNLVISWYGIAGVTYQVYFSNDLINWYPYGSPIAGIGGPLEMVDLVRTDLPQMFFRVQANN